MCMSISYSECKVYAIIKVLLLLLLVSIKRKIKSDMKFLVINKKEMLKTSYFQAFP